ncbi:DSD1 family PLP-dependent enzyme [Veronia pacifica]|uniref:Threonine aldolase n=1 Tax=Veronia pacifica TaxID=1080227 RepID=A0A1C3EQY0_9GAMM|nr:DSD1 family PLP-dependent enzyme [Veronia pacifica]ODA35609.1 threonine aldolase [Veronia pacifica]
MKLEQLDTPALFVDLDVLESNLEAMQQRINKLGVKLRPHTKAHKIPALAQMQIDRGASGICVAKLGEAEVMAAGRIKDILITTPIAGETKYQKLIDLKLRHPKITLIQVIDSKEHVLAIGNMAKNAGVTIPLIIEVESGQQRCGLDADEGLIALIKLINSTAGVSYEGIQAYSGHLQHTKGYEQRNKVARAAVKDVFEFIENELTEDDLRPSIISGGGTGTFEAYQGLSYTEIQAGSYIFMDNAYQKIGDEHQNDINQQFGIALKVLTSVISHPKPNRAVVDAGTKCLSIDMGVAEVESHPDIMYQSGGDEHGILHLPSTHCPELKLGQKLIMHPSHCDTTLHNFNQLVGVRNGEVVTTWQIEGRGRSD